LAILEPGSISVRSDLPPSAAPHGTKSEIETETRGQVPRIDFIIDKGTEFLHVNLPTLIGKAIKVKATSQKDPITFEKNQRKAREQVMNHLARQVQYAFDFGGIGADIVVYGLVLSMISVQVVELQLNRTGTEMVDIVVRQTPHVPLCGEHLVPKIIHKKVAWDMGSDGVLLLASALLDLPRNFILGKDSEQSPSLHDFSAEEYNSQSGERFDVDMKIESLLGSGGFSDVVKLSDNTFMKIPRSMRMVKCLVWECDILRKLGMDADDEKPWFPKTMPWGISVVKMFIHNEISTRKVLRLTGLIGCPLGSCCSGMVKDDVESQGPGICT